VSFAPTGPKEQVNTAGIMVWSIITMLCCNVGSILGIFAVIFSLIAGVEKDFNSDKTKRYLQIAKVCNIVALVIGIIVAILYFTVFAGIIKELQELLSQVGTSTDGFNM
jgi:membrane-associated HD superfamily phosphohydrolase